LALCGTVGIFFRGERAPLVFAIFDNAEYFLCQLTFFVKNTTYTKHKKSLPLHTSDMQKQACKSIQLFFLASPTGAHGGYTRSPTPDQNLASAVLHCSKPISFSRMERNRSLTACSLFSSHQSV
jgi:hypothetical protein